MQAATFSLPNATYPNIDVVGESSYESQIRAQFGRLARDQDQEIFTEAALIPEPDNPYDSNAVSVRIGQLVVGYLSRDDARAYASVLHRVAASGVQAIVPVRIWGVERSDYDGRGSRFYSSVRVALPEPHLVLPLNSPPALPYSILPWGSGLQVTGEDKHFDVLRSYAGRAERSLLLVTLTRSTEQKARGGDREFIEVAVDGQRVGEMSTVSSKHFFALVDHHAAKGLVTAAWGQIKGSALAAEVVLQAAKASEVDDDYLHGSPNVLPSLLPEASSYAVPAAYSGPPRKPAPARARAAAQSAPAAVSTQAAKSGCALVLLAGMATVAGLGAAVNSFLA
jgi:collagen type III alpha